MRRLLGSAILLAALWLIPLPAEPRFPLCLFHWLTGIPCPLCGLTRGLFALATPLTREPIGIALPGNDPLLVNWTQNWLREIEAGGNLELMKDLWFKNTSWLKQLP